MKRIVVTAIIVAAFLPTIPLGAQGTSKRSPPSPEVMRRLETLNHFSKCLATRRPDLADEILSLPLESAEQGMGIHKLIKVFGGQNLQADSCLRAKMMRIKYPPVLLGGMAEERVLRQGLSDTDVLARSATAVTARNPAEAFALCVAARKTEAAVRLIRTRPASNREQAVVGELRSGLHACPFDGGPFAGDDFALRTYVAVGLYLAMNGSSRTQRAQ